MLRKSVDLSLSGTRCAQRRPDEIEQLMKIADQKIAHVIRREEGDGDD